MFIGRIMHKDLVTVSPSASIEEAKILLEEHKIGHLLVVDDEGSLVGILSDRDLKQYWASPATTLSTYELNYLLQQVTVGMVMIKAVITITPETTIERAAFIMQGNDINALPVVERQKLVGIITSTDVMGVVLEAIGINNDNTRISVLINDRIGAMADACIILRDQQIDIRSIFSWPEKKHPGVFQLIMRIRKKDKEKAISALEKEGYIVVSDYKEDIKRFVEK